MRNRATITAVLLAFASLHLAWGFSPIASVDHWDVDRLANVGITIAPWKHDLQSEDPPLEWIRVAFDCSELPEERDVLMTGYIVSDRNILGRFRDERSKGEDCVELIFAAQGADLDQSRLEIRLWKRTPDGEVSDGSGWPWVTASASGYWLSLKRIVELAHEKTAQIDPSGSTNPGPVPDPAPADTPKKQENDHPE